MKRTIVLAAALGAVAVTVAGWIAAASNSGVSASGLMLPYDDADVVASGRKIYAAQCASCHGTNLEGAPDWRMPDADGYLPAPPHDASGHTWHHPDGLLVDITTRGTAAVVGQGYESRMPGFGEVLSEAEILAVLAYIKSTWPDQVIDAHNQINRRHAGR